VEHEIQRQNAELLKLVAEKDKFFSIIAHDLRNQFNVFLGFTQMLEEGVSTMERSKIQKIVGLLRSTALDVFDLLENLLEWSRIERGITSFEPRSVLLAKQLQESLHPVFESANKKGIKISIDIPGNMAVFADPNMLRSILRNLASNAVKFTPKSGNIIISARMPTIRSIEIAVKDSGIGMEEDMIGKLFFQNEQINRKGTEGEPSSGLGLFICKDFVEKHGGKIWAESTVDKGSTFYFTIPSEQGSDTRSDEIPRTAS
jgi:signal transduction histidine kinase